ncbi:hypothetical protein BJX62DRAFT_240521 [Aspergillus germanicus]
MPPLPPPQRSTAKRDKYTSHACGECQRRKVKCSGEAVCSNCQTRGAKCQYEDVGPRGPKPKRPAQEAFNFKESASEYSNQKRRKSRATLRDQLAQLQEKVDELMQGHNHDPPANPSNPPEFPQGLSPFASPPTLHDGNNSHRSTESLFNGSAGATSLEAFGQASIFQDTDVFYAQSPGSSSIALSSQITAIKGTACPKNSSRGRLLSIEPIIQPHLIVQLPDPTTLWAQVTTFLAEFGCYFPCLHEDRLCGQLSAALETVGYDEYHTQVLVDEAQCQIIAILFNMLAYAEALSQSSLDSGDPMPNPGAQHYSQGIKLIEHFKKVHGSDLQTTVYHTTACAYLLELGMLQMAFQSVSRAFQTALCIGLNDQDRWPDNTEDEDIACRQSLWWTIFFLDKRVAQKIGIAYSVRQTECAVKEFLGDHGSLPPQAHHELLQSMILFSQLWAQIWDLFFSPHKQDKDPGEEMQLTDMKIILAYRRVPPRLRWRSQKMHEYIAHGDSEREVRRRLLVFLRFAFLRLSIRHKTIHNPEQNRERRRSCISICLAIIEGVRAYTDTFGYHKPSGHVLTSALVESLFCIFSEQQCQEQEQEQKQEQEQEQEPAHNECSADPVVSQQTLEQAKSCSSLLLHRLAVTITGASRACEALHEVLPRIPSNCEEDKYGEDSLAPSLVGRNHNPQGLQEDSSSLCDLWRTTSEVAGQEYDPESTVPQWLMSAKSENVSPSFGEFGEGLEDPFDSIVAGLDWESLLRTLPT